jgi:hypothetical protein
MAQISAALEHFQCRCVQERHRPRGFPQEKPHFTELNHTQEQ